MSDQIEMPVNCGECGGVWDLNDTYANPRDRYGSVVCPPCKREIDAEEGGNDE